MFTHRIVFNKRTSIRIACSTLFTLGSVGFLLSDLRTPSTHAESSTELIEKAMFTRQEFFGSDAIVPIPTALARENLAKLAATNADDPLVLENLAGLDEKLSNFDEAEQCLKKAALIEPKNIYDLANFYDRRARFADEGKELRRILSAVEPDRRAEVFSRILDLARAHELNEYLRPEFYREIIAENTDVFPIFEDLIDRLIKDESESEALEFLRQAKTQFPEKRAELLDREVSLLSGMGKDKEAESVYAAAFDPFWNDDQTEKFYEFLSENDRLREYGGELKSRFDKDNADFDTAIRLAHYKSYRSEDITRTILRLEKAKKVWSSDELLTVARFLIRENEGDLASRFLYTLYNRGDLKEKGDLRARILYQLFELFLEAGNQELSLTRGDLRFYRQAATIDTSPGIATGILSLIFSDTNPGGELEEKESEANKYFNRAAAYRIFIEYKQENPTSRELGQMYLDIVRLYAETRDVEIAKTTLDDFAGRYQNSADFPRVALELADAFVAGKDAGKSREIYRAILDRFDNPDKTTAAETKISTITGDSTHRPGRQESFHDALMDHPDPVTYREVLERLVDSLSKEKKVPEILELFSNEIKRFPKCEWLYEWRLSWLEQTNLTEQQLAAYQEALDRFQSSSWSDKLARWLLRKGRKSEFEKLSADFVGKLDDAEVQGYLSEFINAKVPSNEFERQLYLKLYLSAHQRFPHDPAFVMGLLNFYKTNKQNAEWQKLAAEYYFESPEVRKLFLDDVAERTKLREFLANTPLKGEVYDLFRADASVRLSNFEQAAQSYRKLNSLYPNNPELAEPLLALTRSFGQKDGQSLADAANFAHEQAEFSPSSAIFRTRSGELYAELGDYGRSRVEWDKVIGTASGDRQIYLDTATVYWDYFQYQDALRTIKTIRAKFKDQTLCSFEAGAIDESLHDIPAAISEYINALDAAGDEEQQEKAKNRLATLSKRNGGMVKISAAFAAERSKRKDPTFLTLGYAQFLAEIDKNDESESILDSAIGASRNTEFLTSSLDFYSNREIKSGEQAALKRLAEITESPRRTIKYRLRLADSFEETHDREKARATVADLVAKFPTNYGVVTMASDLYHRLGFENESVGVLQAALSRSRGTYKSEIAGKLSTRLIQLNRLDEGEMILTKLHSENKADLDLFRDLAGIYVRKNQPQLLRTAFAETVAAIKASGKDRREIDDDIAGFRTQMIDAFTRLKDYRSAIEQHIEIINRDPDDAQLTDNAIYYAKRYGGADTLLAYYQKTSNEAFKNYRWNVVLGRIYDAAGDAQNAVRNYRAAIVNQPEMDELYAASAELEIKRGDLDAALKDLNSVLELTNDKPEYINKKIDVLKKMGRNAEAEVERAKLPVENEPKPDDDKFVEAAKLQATEDKDKARELFREAFGQLSKAPLDGEITAAGLTGYVRAVREQEPLQNITGRLWILREKLIALADETDSTNAGEARKRLSIFDGALTESVGNILKTTATDDELAAVHADLANRIDAGTTADQHQTLGLIRDLSNRAAFGDLEEKILLKKLNDPDPLYRKDNIRNIVSFYNDRGAYEKAFDVVEQYPGDDLAFVAEQARLAGHADKELETLRAIYWKPSEKLAAAPDRDVTRYLDLIYKDHKNELADLAAKPSAYQFQLINFLLGKGERALAHTAIENSVMSLAWKVSRNAETSLALKEFGADAVCYFCKALQFDSIGGMIAQPPDKQRFLVGEDWFRLTREYGEWLYRSPGKTQDASLYLTAMTEDRPRNAGDQAALGSFYLDQNDATSAVEHFRIAVEQDPDNTAAQTDLGAAYYRAGKKDWASEMFQRAISDRSGPNDYLTFFEHMRQFGLAAEARRSLVPKIVEFLETNNVGNSDDIEKLIRSIAASFNNENEKTAYFEEFLKRRPMDTSVAKMLVSESLVDTSHADVFFERLISENDALSNYDYDSDFKSVLQRTWSADDAESVYDHEDDYKIAEPENERIKWRRAFLEVLLDRHDDGRAAAIIASIEKDIKGKYARPEWLRLARLHLDARAGRFDLKQAERFVGISVSDSVAEIKAPDINRFNGVVQMLKEEKNELAANRLAECFFSRHLALGRLDTANISGLAGVSFKTGEIEQAAHLLHLMIDAIDESTRPAAIAQIEAVKSVKDQAADSAKLSDGESQDNYSLESALELAADISAEFERRDDAVAFRRVLLQTAAANTENKIKLVNLLAENGDESGAVSLLTEIVNDRDVTRASRWDAKWRIHEINGNGEISDVGFDPFSQFYQGLLAKRSSDTGASFLINSLIAGDEAEISARQELMKIYATIGKPFAALKLADSDKSKKSDDLLRILSNCAERIEDLPKAIELEKQRTDGGDKSRIDELQRLADKAAEHATNLIVDSANTRKL